MLKRVQHDELFKFDEMLKPVQHDELFKFNKMLKRVQHDELFKVCRDAETSSARSVKL